MIGWLFIIKDCCCLLITLILIYLNHFCCSTRNEGQILQIEKPPDSTSLKIFITKLFEKTATLIAACALGAKSGYWRWGPSGENASLVNLSGWLFKSRWFIWLYWWTIGKTNQNWYQKQKMTLPLTCFKYLHPKRKAGLSIQ
jgi:hypothetical protein